MSNKLNILCLAGSLRKDSLNKQILEIVVKKIKSFDVSIIDLDLNKSDIIIYNQDIEDQGVPQNVKNFKAQFHDANAFVFASPEYNGSITGALKNALDWVSRKMHKDEEMYQAFKNKPAGIIAASPSPYGGMRGVRHLHDILVNLNCFVMPQHVCIGNAYEINDEKIKKLEKFAEDFTSFAKRLI